jgi:hypothetical protein
VSGKAKLSITVDANGRTLYIWSGPQKYFNQNDTERLEVTLAKIRTNLEELKTELSVEEV